MGNKINSPLKQLDRVYDLSIGTSCLTASFTKRLVYDNGIVRELSGDEMFKYMGFTDDEINLSGLNENQKQKLAGNGWDINLVSKIFCSLNLKKEPKDE